MSKIKTILIIIFLISNMGTVFASSRVGIRLKIKTLTLEVHYYNTQGVYYSKNELNYVIDPSRLLFDLIFFLQNNGVHCNSSKCYYYFSIEKEEGDNSITAVHKISNEREVFRDYKFTKLSEKLLRGIIFYKTFKIRNFKAGKKIILYKTKDKKLIKKYQHIIFGAMPGFTGRATTYYFIEPVKNAKKIIVSRKTIGQYFKRIPGYIGKRD